MPDNVVYATLSASTRLLQSSPFFRAFVCSFLANVPSADLVLFTHPPDTTALLASKLVHPRISVLPLVEADKDSLQIARYTSYRKHLRAHEPSRGPRRVALVDASDVVFQGDPFDAILVDERTGAREALYVTEESRDYSLGTQSSNSLWVRELYGEVTLGELRQLPVLCSGFTMGHVRRCTPPKGLRAPAPQAFCREPTHHRVHSPPIVRRQHRSGDTWLSCVSRWPNFDARAECSA